MATETLAQRVPRGIAFALFAVVLALAGGGALAMTLSVQTSYALALIAALVIAFLAYLSGNTRMVLLFGLAMAIPLDLDKRFMSVPHFGGEIAIRVELSDLFMLALAGLWFADVYYGQIKTLRVPRVLMWWGAYILLSLVMFPLWNYRSLAAYEVIRMSKLVLLAILLPNVIRRQRQLDFFVASLLFAALLQSGYGLLQQFLSVNLPLEKFGQLQSQMTEQLGMSTASRVGAMLGHPNMLGAFLILVLPIGLALVFGAPPFYLRLLSATTLMLGIPALVFTLSRAAWLGFGFSACLIIGVSFLHPRTRYKQLTFRVLVVTVLAAMGVLLSGRVFEKFYLSAATSIDARVIWMKIAWSMIKSNYFAGVGLNAFTFYFDQYDPTAIPWGDMPPPVHNIYLLVFAEQGLPGIIAFALALFAVVRAGIQNLRIKDDHLIVVGLGLFGGACAIFIQGLADFTFRGNAVMRTFFTLVGLLAAVQYLGQDSPVNAARGQAAETAAEP